MRLSGASCPWRCQSRARAPPAIRKLDFRRVGTTQTAEWTKLVAATLQATAAKPEPLVRMNKRDQSQPLAWAVPLAAAQVRAVLARAVLEQAALEPVGPLRVLAVRPLAQVAPAKAEATRAIPATPWLHTSR